MLQSNFFQYHLDEIKDFKDGHFSKAIYELLNLDKFEDFQQFNKCLSKYKYPIDYIRSKKWFGAIVIIICLVFFDKNQHQLQKYLLYSE